MYLGFLALFIEDSGELTDLMCLYQVRLLQATFT
jgi:hypothetical protein